MKSITRHLSLTQFILIILVTFSFCVGLYYYVQRVLVQGIDDSLRNQAETLVQLIEIDDDDHHDDDDRDDRDDEFYEQQKRGKNLVEVEIEPSQLAKHSSENGLQSYYIINQKGQLIYQSQLANEKVFRSIPQPTDGPVKKLFGNIASEDGNTYRYIQFYFNPKDEHRRQSSSQWQLVILRDTKDLSQTLATLVRGSLLCGGTFILVSSLLSALNIRRSLKPLNSIAAEVAALDASQLNYRFSTDKLPSELSQIADKLNALLQGLEQAFLRERSFSGSAAHELRTPLAELKAIAQVGAGWQPGDPSHPSPVGYFKDSESIINRMQSLMGSLLTLIDQRPDMVDIQWEEINLVQAVEMELAEHQEHEACLDVVIESSTSRAVIADPALLSGILKNIISNALDYSDPNSRICCTISDQGEQSILKLTNYCQSLSLQDVEQMSDAFWRKEKSRTGTLHQGLGIGLAQTYARCMGCELKLEYVPEHQLEITLLGLEKVLC